MIIKLDDDTYFSTTDGVVVSRSDARKATQRAILNERNLSVDETFVRIKGKDSVRIDLSLLGRNATVPAPGGFLITVFFSGSDGKYTRLYRDPVIDPADLTVARGSFSDYIDLEVDK